jgi:hypothetical protein
VIGNRENRDSKTLILGVSLELAVKNKIVIDLPWRTKSEYVVNFCKQVQIFLDFRSNCFQLTKTNLKMTHFLTSQQNQLSMETVVMPNRKLNITSSDLQLILDCHFKSV